MTPGRGPSRRLTYENALLPRALIVAGRRLGSDADDRRPAWRALDWLIDDPDRRRGQFSPIGNGWWPRGGERSRFDQQPIEATALLLAAEAAFDDRRRALSQPPWSAAYAWFLGANDVGRRGRRSRRAAPASMASRPTGVNPNQGAESTLMWLVALEHIRRARPAGGPVRLVASVGVATPTGCPRTTPSSARCAAVRGRWRAARRPGRDAADPPRTDAVRRLPQPDPHRRRRPLPRQLGLQPRRRAGRRRDDPAGPRRGPARHLAAPRRAQRRRRDRLDLRSGAAAPVRRREPPRGDLGLRGPAADLAPRARGVGDRLHRVQPPRPAGRRWR